MKRRTLFNLIILSSFVLASCKDNSSSSNSISSSYSSVDTTTTSTSTSTSSDSDDSIYYTITWKNYDDSLLATSQVKEGETAIYPLEEEPSRARTDQYTYIFSGWDHELKNVMESFVTKAVFVEKINQYTISFETNGGTVIDSIVDNYGASINAPNETPKLDGFRFVGWCYDKELTQAVEWPITLVSDLTLYASYNEKIDIMGYFNNLLNSYSKKPSDYLPATMLAGHKSTLIDESSYSADYSQWRDVSTINYHGHGEQWKMITDNILQSNQFFTVLDSISAINTTVIALFNNYLDENPSDEAHYSTSINENSIDYNVMINFDGTNISYVLEFIFLAMDVQISMSMNVLSSDLECRIQLDEANALKYEITEDSYKFAIRYLGFRRAYFEVSQTKDNNTTGKIVEYLSVDNVFSACSAALFEINDDYCVAVGNKANGMLGFEGYIVELYDVESGYFLGYKVQETMSLLQDGTYHTLWFKLSDISGINKIKMIPTSAEEEDRPKSGYHTYLNNRTNEFIPTYNTKLFVKTSRKYDIEMRNFYYYYYDENNELSVLSTVVPMMFIQDDNDVDTNYSDFKDDMLDDNALDVSITMTQTNLDNLRSYYDNLIPEFIQIKDTISVEYILNFIGDKK